MKTKNNLLTKIPGCNKRPQKYIKDVDVNFTLNNAQSLKFKLNSMEKGFELNSLSFAMVTISKNISGFYWSSQRILQKPSLFFLLNLAGQRLLVVVDKINHSHK